MGIGDDEIFDNVLYRQSRQGRLLPGEQISIASHGTFYPYVSFEIPDHVRNLLMLEQYKHDDELKTIIIGFLRQMNDIEAEILNMKNMLDIEQAFGWWLDIAGAKVGALRNGLNDDLFRDEIKFRIFINNSWGQPNVIQAFAEYVTQATDIEYFEDYPAKIILRVNSTLNLSKRHKEMIQAIAVGGVAINLISSVDGYVFAYEWEAPTTPDPRHKGFAELLQRNAEYYYNLMYKYGTTGFDNIALNGVPEVWINESDGVKFDFDFNIDSNTWISFDLQLENTDLGLSSYYGFEFSDLPKDDDTITESRFFQLAGNDNFGIQDYKDIVPAGTSYQNVTFNIGSHYSLNAKFICFKNQHSNQSPSNIRMRIRNLKLYQELTNPPIPNGGKYSDWI